MDLYRIRSRKRESFNWKCDQYLWDLLGLAQPPIQEVHFSDIEKLSHLEARIFFPKSAIRRFVKDTDNLLHDLIYCDCPRCQDGPATTASVTTPQRHALERGLIGQAAHENSPLIVGILIYLGETRKLYNLFAKADNFRGGVDSVFGIEDLNPVFANNFRRAKCLFDPPTLEVGSTEKHYPTNTRLPFLDIGPCGNGTTSKVTKFTIHKDYIAPSVRAVAEKYLAEGGTVHPSQGLLFARKTIQGARAQSLEKRFRLEQDVLLVICRQDEKHRANIIDLIAFYTFGDEINLVFPYVEGSLEAVLAGSWEPTSMERDNRKPFPGGWLTHGMIGVAKGLSTIHDPPDKIVGGRKIVGFHFDLKPANILVTRLGVFKISDFGQAMIQLQPMGGYYNADDYYGGGDPEYAPPESRPSRAQVEQHSRRLSAISTPGANAFPIRPEENSRASSNLVVRNPESSQNQGSFAGDRRSSRSFARSITATEPEAMGSARYDIWSYACILLEVLVFRQLGGTQGVQTFRDDRLAEDDSRAFYTYHQPVFIVKKTVRQRLEQLSGRQEDGRDGLSTKSIEDYMDTMVQLLNEMLQIEDHQRPAAGTIVSRMEKMLDDYHAAENVEARVFNRLRHESLPSDDFKEKASDNYGTPFMYMQGVKFQADPTEQIYVDCKLRVFLSKENLLIWVAYEENSRAELQRLIFKRASSQYCPGYLFDRDNRWEMCRLVSTETMTEGYPHVSKSFWFPSKHDALLSFQAAVLEQSVVLAGSTADAEGDFSSIETPSSITVTFKGITRPKRIKCEVFALQIWYPWTKRASSHRPTQTTESTTSAEENSQLKRTLAFFVKGNGRPAPFTVLQMPLGTHYGLSEVHELANHTVRFLPLNPKRQKNNFTIWSSNLSTTITTGLHCPALTLDTRTNGETTGKLRKEECLEIETVFRTSSGIDILRGQIEKVNILEAQQKHKNRIVWEALSSSHSPR